MLNIFKLYTLGGVPTFLPDISLRKDFPYNIIGTYHQENILNHRLREDIENVGQLLDFKTLHFMRV